MYQHGLLSKSERLLSSMQRQIEQGFHRLILALVVQDCIADLNW
jgi:hypothetical protein